MSTRTVTVRIEPGNNAIQVEPGLSAREAAAQAGIPIDSPCGGQGSCGKCKIRVVSDAGPLTPAEYTLLQDIEVAAGYRLACQVRVQAPLYFEIPEESLQKVSFQILTHTGCLAAQPEDPTVKVVALDLPAPSLHDARADLTRLQDALPAFAMPLELLRELPAKLRHAHFKGVALIVDGSLLSISPRPPLRTHVAAFDLGTTTLVGALLDARSGRVLARASAINPQVHFGDDVLTRISYAADNRGHLQRLQQCLVEAMNALLVEMVNETGGAPDEVLLAACSGNTTMQHLLLGIDPTPIGLSPYVPALDQMYTTPAAPLGLRLHPRASLHTLPMIGGYVGGDTVAGLLATNLHPAPGPALFIDIGTNGEMVLCNGEQMIATSCAAGPAFEGARIGQGMRAAEGAIEAVAIRDEVHFSTIGGKQPVGICGSALIDVAAELLRLGVITPDGALHGADSVRGKIPDAVCERIRSGDRGAVFVIAEAEETATGVKIALTQRDVRELQLATAAIRSGIQTLVSRAGLQTQDLQRVLVAGAFGNYIRCHNAQQIGLLPLELPVERFEFVGNTSLAGACMTALDEAQRRKAQTLAAKAEHLELSMDPEFQEVYVDCLAFPVPE